MTFNYTEEEKDDIRGMLRTALANDFVKKYETLLTEYVQVCGDEFIDLVESINPYSVGTQKVGRYLNLYAASSKKFTATLALNHINDVFGVEDYDEIWVENVKVLVMTKQGWYAA